MPAGNGARCGRAAAPGGLAISTRVRYLRLRSRRSERGLIRGDGRRPDRPIASVIIPAHNEELVIGRLLRGLIGDQPGRLEIIVVCNGCTDGTAAVAAAHGPGVQVIELAEPSKRAALVLGDAEATVFPRLFVDADVELSAESVDRLVSALSNDGVLAAAPERTIPRDGVSPLVRWYYDVWEQLPQVRGGLFGRGVIALSEAGNERVRRLPGDDG